MEQIGFFTGLGVVLVLISAAVAGRITAVPRLVTETPVVPEQTVSAEDEEETVDDDGATRVIR
jgi:hypothetical protein